MALKKKIKQFRLFSEPIVVLDNEGLPVKDENGNIQYDFSQCDKNFPQEATLDQWESGEVFNKAYPMTQLGIQGMPGTRFYLNGNVKPIVIGASGIFDLEVKNGARVTSLGFDRQSLSTILNSGTNYLIVDVLYEEED